MNYIKIDFENVNGYQKLSDNAKALFERTYKVYNSGQGYEYKEEWIPVKVKEHRQYLEVHFFNKNWLKFYANGTWG